MKTAIARIVMAMADRCLGDHRREWALAMQAEFDTAVEDRDALRFAVGCLLGAWREMPAREEGRFVLASYLLAIGLLLPMAAVLIMSVLLGLPYPAIDHVVAGGPIAGHIDAAFPRNDAHRAALPLLAIMMLSLGLGHLRMAWLMLERDWLRVAIMGRLGAAMMVTLTTFTGVLFLYDARALPQAAVMAIELAAVWSLVRWHGELPVAAARQPRSGRC